MVGRNRVTNVAAAAAPGERAGCLPLVPAAAAVAVGGGCQ